MYHRWHTMKKKYALSPEGYEALVVKQGGLCAICGGEGYPYRSGRRGLHVDHDHMTGVIRGLLCMRCNSSLEHYMLYHNAIKDYLNEH